MNTPLDKDLSSAATVTEGKEISEHNLSASAYDIEMQNESTTSLFTKVYRGLTAPVRLLPDFLIIGTQRGGTTSLYNYLQTHPCIGTTTTKEIHFFDRRYSKGLAWYRGHFPSALEKYYVQRLQGRAYVTGEASPSYLFHPHVPKRVARALPHVKLIVMLRNPVDRAYSQHHHVTKQGYGTLSFEETIRGEEEIIAKEREKMLQDESYESYAYRHASYLSRGIYVDQLQTWMKVFPREQFLILKSEDFYANPAGSFKQVLTFLGVPQTELQVEEKEFKNYNNNVYSSKMDPQMRSRLIEYFKPHNTRLYDFLGVDFGWDE